MMLSCISMVSCNKDQNVNGGLIDVELSSTTPETKTEVTPGGVTRWSMCDKVIIIDADQTPRTFTYASSTATATAKFKGRLLGNQGDTKYYAYFDPQYADCELSDGYYLTVDRNDINISGDNITNSALFGQHCPMIGIPRVFDIEDPTQTKGFQFYHINCLIEASICSIEGDDRLRDMIFDKAVFEMIATTEEKPFNTKIRVNMDEILGPPKADLPYTSTGEMVDRMCSTFSLDSAHKFGDLLEDSDISSFGIPIFALPTNIPFEYQLNVMFYLDDEVVCHLRKNGIATGLKAAGLNVSDFCEEDMVEQPTTRLEGVFNDISTWSRI